MNLQESNKKALEKILWESPEMNKMRESFQKKFGFDMKDEKKFPVREAGFSFSKAAEKAKLLEADDKAGFAQLLRAGIQNIVNLTMFEPCGTVYEQWVKVVSSNKDTELYAPLTAMGFPSELAAGGKYPEVAAYGLDISLKNKVYGAMHAVSWYLNEDDQTGQVAQLAGLMGEYFKVLFEIVCNAKLASVSGGCTYSNLKISASETKPSNESSWPWVASAGLVGGGSNRPATFVAPTQANIQNAFIAMRGQKNQLGLTMNVDPDVILHSPKYEFDITTIANSNYFPSNVIATNAGTTVGGPLSINPLQGKFKPLVTRYMFDNNGVITGDSKAWYALDTKKPFMVLQMRSGPQIVNEAPNSGASFENDLIRFKGNVRCNADFIEPRFAYQGNDGSV